MSQDRAALPNERRKLRPLLTHTGLRLLPALVVLTLIAAAALPAAASADGRIEAGVKSPWSVAVSAREGGNVYDVEAEAPQERVSEFEPNGAFVRAFGWGVLDGASELQVCTSLPCHAGLEGAGPGQLNWSDALAVDNDSSSSSYGDVYLVDQRNFRVEKFSPSGQFELMFGGEIDKGPHHPGNLCTAAYLAEGDTCGAGSPGTGHGFFEEVSKKTSWSENGSNSIAVGPDGTVYVGDYRRVQEFEPGGAYKGELTLPGQQFITSLAVDAAGHVFALSPAVNERQLVKLPASGTFTLEFEGQHTGPLPSNPSQTEFKSALEALTTIGAGNVNVLACGGGECLVEFTGALAKADEPLLIASAGSVEPRREGAPGELAELAGPGALDPSEVLHTYDTEAGAEPTHLALDSAGNLFVTDLDSGNPQFRAFHPDGTLYAEFTSPQVVFSAGSGYPKGIAIGAGTLYAAAFKPSPFHIAVIPLSVAASGPPEASKQSATEIEPTTATLHAVVNPRGYDTHYRFQYITQRRYEEDANSFGAGTEQTALTHLGLLVKEDPVSAAVSNLSPDTAYRYRVLAESECEPEAHPGHVCLTEGEGVPGGEGSDATFTTLPPVSVRDFTTQTVGPELVELKAELSPDNGSATHYTISYGEDEACSGGSTSGEVHALGNAFEKVTATFEHLKPNTTYHYCLEVINSYGEAVKSTGTFTTEPSAAEERAAEDCPENGTVHGAPGGSTLREQDNSLALPDCRAYEQVSPVFKAGYGILPGLFNFAPGGENAGFASSGAFAGAVWSHSLVKYFAHRTPSGWVTQAALRRPYPDSEPNGPNAADPELDKWVFALNEGASNFSNSEVHQVSSYFGASDGTTTKASPIFEDFEGGLVPNPQVEPAAESPDLSTLLYLTGTRFLESDPLPTESGGIGRSRLYEVSGAGGPSPTLSLLAEVPAGLGEKCEIDRTVAQGTNVVSADGSTVFYTAPLALQSGESCPLGNLEGPNTNELFVRFGQEPAVEISAESPAQCSSGHPCHGAAPRDAHFDGATPTGSAAWLTTVQPLIDSDTDNTNDLYLARLAGGQVSELVQASAGEATANHPHPGEGAGVQGVLGVSAEGNVAYFVATGELTEAPDPTTGQRAAQGAENLYAYDSESEQLKFVARLCSGPEESGSVHDPACGANLNVFDPEGRLGGVINDGNLWANLETGQDQLTPDGRYLLFASFGRLTRDDTDTARDVYRYDFQTGELARLSFARDGNDGNGNDNAYDAEIPQKPEGAAHMGANELAGDTTRSISADGSVAIFRTAAPLTSHDTNLGADPSCEFGHSGCDVYEWEEQGHVSCAEAGGCVRLASDGLDPHGTNTALIGASGRDIALVTGRGLVPADTDGVADVYDARENGGFPPPPPPPPCKEGGSPEVCHGESTHESLKPSYTSEETHSGGNGPTELNCAKGRHKVKKHGQIRCVPDKKHHHKKKHHKHHHKRAAHHNRGGGK